MLNLELIKSLEEDGETVSDCIDNDKSAKILAGDEITGTKALNKVEKLVKYLDKKGNKAKIYTVAMLIDNIASTNGKDLKERVQVITADELTEKEMDEWRNDLSKSDDGYNKANLISPNEEQYIGSSNVVFAHEAEEDLQMDSQYKDGFVEAGGFNHKQEFVFKTASSLCENEGINSIRELSDITETASSTLNDMFHKYPRRFLAIVIGAGQLKIREDRKKYNECFPS